MESWCRTWPPNGSSRTVQNKNFSRNPEKLAKVLEPNRSRKSHLHGQFLGIWQSLWKSFLESLYVDTTQIRNKWGCWNVQDLLSATVITTASGKAESTEEATVYVDDLRRLLLEDSSAVLSFGLLMRINWRLVWIGRGRVSFFFSALLLLFSSLPHLFSTREARVSTPRGMTSKLFEPMLLYRISRSRVVSAPGLQGRANPAKELPTDPVLALAEQMH